MSFDMARPGAVQAKCRHCKTARSPRKNCYLVETLVLPKVVASSGRITGMVAIYHWQRSNSKAKNQK